MISSAITRSIESIEGTDDVVRIVTAGIDVVPTYVDFTLVDNGNNNESAPSETFTKIVSLATSTSSPTSPLSALQTTLLNLLTSIAITTRQVPEYLKTWSAYLRLSPSSDHFTIPLLRDPLARAIRLGVLSTQTEDVFDFVLRGGGGGGGGGGGFTNVVLKNLVVDVNNSGSVREKVKGALER